MRLCDGVSYIQKVSDGSKQGNDVTRIKEIIAKSLETLRPTKDLLQNSLTVTDTEKEEHIKSVHCHADRLVEHVRDLEKGAIDDINGKHKVKTDNLMSGIKSLDAVEMAMKRRLENLDNFRANSNSQVFVDIKRGQQEVETVRELTESLESVATGNAMGEFVVQEDVTYFLNEVTCLGESVVQKVYKADLHGEYNVEMPGDKYVCSITGGCELSNGSILLADGANRCIKKLNKSYNTIECLKLPTYPHSICKAGWNEVAVSLDKEKKVQFINVSDKMKMTRDFRVEDSCWGVCYNRGELFVACGGSQGKEGRTSTVPGYIGVYNMSGSLLRKLQLDRLGHRMLSTPLQVAAFDEGNRLVVIDRERGIIIMARQGHVLSTCSEGLKGASGACVLPDFSVVVSGYDSNNVVHLDSAFEVVTEMLCQADGVMSPTSLLFLRGCSRLILTEELSNKIKIYNLV